jgi:outer membrane protein TolC
MKKQLISLFFLGVAVSGVAQNEYDAILKEIESNSLPLKALRAQTEAQQSGNRTGLAPANPEIEWSYLWGSPSVIGNRTDLSVRQSFDFPTAYIHRHRISRLENARAELAYQSERLRLLLSARQVCIRLTYYNALVKACRLRLQNAERLAESYRIKLNRGEANALENNKAQLNWMNLQNELRRIENERAGGLSELRQMNGGQALDFAVDRFPPVRLPDDFERYYAQAEAQNPALQYAKAQIEINRQQIRLNRSMGLPGFSAGYLSEKVAGEHFQGFTLGMSIPLWENKNRVKQSRAQAAASGQSLMEQQSAFYSQLQRLHARALVLQQNVVRYRTALEAYGNASLLQKALDAGELSLLEYLLEMTYYYEALDKALEEERELALVVAELFATH